MEEMFKNKSGSTAVEPGAETQINSCAPEPQYTSSGLSWDQPGILRKLWDLSLERIKGKG